MCVLVNFGEVEFGGGVCVLIEGFREFYVVFFKFWKVYELVFFVLFFEFVKFFGYWIVWYIFVGELVLVNLCDVEWVLKRYDFIFKY